MVWEVVKPTLIPAYARAYVVYLFKFVLVRKPWFVLGVGYCRGQCVGFLGQEAIVRWFPPSGSHSALVSSVRKP